MTPRREPHGSGRDPHRRGPRDPYDPDPYERDPYGRGPGGDDGDATPAWGRPPVGGWGEPGEYGRGTPEPHDGEAEYGWQQPEYEPAGAGPGHGARDHGDREPSWSPGYAPTPRRAARRRRHPPGLAVGVAAAVVVAVLVLAFVTPGWFVTRVLDASAVQTGVAKILSEDYGMDAVADVRCPGGVQVTVGATFTCDAAVDGDPIKIPVRVTDGNGGYEVGRPT